MAIGIDIHPDHGSYSAEIRDHGTFHVLKISDDVRGVEMKIFGGFGHGDALKMMADVFNDAFKKPKTAPADAAQADDDDIPF